jgi:hypothetical protein
MRPWLPMLAALATACATLPDSQPLPGGEESAHAVTEIAPGRWHVMVRVNYFAPRTEAERLLRERAAALCPDAEAVVEDLHLVSQPHQASGDVRCRERQAAGPGLGPIENRTMRGVENRAVATAPGPVRPPVQEAPERPMVKSGPGLIACRPEPGYLPAYVQVATGHGEVSTAASQAPAAAEETEIAGGWIPATGHAEGPRALVVAEEDLAATPPAQAGEAAAAKEFWPAVGAAYHGLVAEAE